MKTQQVISLCLLACLLTSTTKSVSLWETFSEGVKKPFRKGREGGAVKTTAADRNHAQSCVRLAEQLGGHILNNVSSDEDLVNATRDYILGQVSMVHKLRCDSQAVHQLIEEETTKEKKCQESYREFLGAFERARQIKQEAQRTDFAISDEELLLHLDDKKVLEIAKGVKHCHSA